ncbi:MAG: glutathione S-transferase family protein [Armatimonadetes bacterium]|nr:glutathione S-transferase family protein [Armatimonadota bacterium]
MRLYGAGPSRWMRPYWILQELGVEFEPVLVDMQHGEHRSEEFLKLNPCGKVPVLIHGDHVITESAAMCLYLAEKFPDKGLLPQPGTPESADHHRWVFFAVTEIEQPLWRMARHRFLYAPEDRNPGEVKLARREALEALKVLDKHLEGKQYVLGDRFSAADVILGYAVVWASWENLLRHFPNLQGYNQTLHQRPAFPDLLKKPPTPVLKG